MANFDVHHVVGQAQSMYRQFRKDVNATLKPYQAFDLVVYTLLCTVTAVYLYSWYRFFKRHGFFATLKRTFFKYVKKLPIVQRKIAEENAKVMKTFDGILPVTDDMKYPTLPSKGRKKDEILKDFQKWDERDAKLWRDGKVSGCVYHGGDELTDLLSKAFAHFALSNPLHADVFPTVRKMEAEVIRMVVNLYNGSSDACGCMTSGGTESILMACKTYRDRALEERGITEPEIIIPSTAHAAFDKAGGYFGIKIVKIPVDPTTCKADLKRTKAAINGNTIALVGSAPSFPQGVIDPIDELSQMAVKYGLGLHVDACLGGFLIPFMEKAGFSMPLFDFRLKGVSSISCDTHKYGFAPKGSSIVMYSSSALRKYQYFVAADWSGGIYASPAVAGSRPGALAAGAWAAMMYMGETGYVETTRAIVNAARKVQAGIAKIDGVYVMGSPSVSVVAFAAEKPLNVYAIADSMGKKHWNLNSLQHPACVHICFTALSAKNADQFLVDLAECVKEVRADPAKYAKGSAAIYGMAASIPDTSLVADIAKGYLDTMYKV
eukprot:GILK01001371.1.p1 GENE.GILK01001371.1~~GILK01001371.1.p1  ORF type:complete len:560 (+),score=86.52 GILK01001371.1:38-1681(+)